MVPSPKIVIFNSSLNLARLLNPSDFLNLYITNKSRNDFARNIHDFYIQSNEFIYAKFLLQDI